MKIKIHDTTYIFLLISFISGYFEYIFLLLLIIFIHESGHYYLSKLIGLKVKEIIIYPLGGITILDEKLNIEIYKEFISLIGGILFQLIFWYIIFISFKNNLITLHTFNIINKINFILISFNFMPILPLDGGRLLNILLDKIFKYLLSYKITISISILFGIIFLLKFRTFLSLIIFIYLLKELYKEYKNIYIKYLLFLYERKSNKFNFKKIKFINNINDFYRDKYHFINEKNEYSFLNSVFL